MGTGTGFSKDDAEFEINQEFYNEFMWPGRFAECISVEETIQKMKKR